MWASFVDQGLDLTFSSRKKVFTSDSMQTHFEICTQKLKLDLVLCYAAGKAISCFA
jgi:hypothetical protein